MDACIEETASQSFGLEADTRSEWKCRRAFRRLGVLKRAVDNDPARQHPFLCSCFRMDVFPVLRFPSSRTTFPGLLIQVDAVFGRSHPYGHRTSLRDR